MNATQETETDDPDGIYDCTVTAADGHPVSMRDYAGQVLLIVNTASRAVSRRNMRGLRNCTGGMRIAGSRSLPFPVTSSRIRNRAMQRKSPVSVRSTMT